MRIPRYSLRRRRRFTFLSDSRPLSTLHRTRRAFTLENHVSALSHNRRHKSPEDFFPLRDRRHEGILSSAGSSIFKTFYVSDHEGRPSSLSYRRDPVFTGSECKKAQSGYKVPLQNTFARECFNYRTLRFLQSWIYRPLDGGIPEGRNEKRPPVGGLFLFRIVSKPLYLASLTTFTA